VLYAPLPIKHCPVLYAPSTHQTLCGVVCPPLLGMECLTRTPSPGQMGVPANTLPRVNNSYLQGLLLCWGCQCQRACC
jgi:hypothetical protein